MLYLTVETGGNVLIRYHQTSKKSEPKYFGSENMSIFRFAPKILSTAPSSRGPIHVAAI